MHAQTTVTGKSSGNMSCPLNVPTFLVAVVEDTPSPSATRSEVLAPQDASGTLQHRQDSTKGTEFKPLVSPLGCLSLCVPWGLFCTLTLSQGPLKSNNNTISDPPVGTARFCFFFVFSCVIIYVLRRTCKEKISLLWNLGQVAKPG